VSFSKQYRFFSPLQREFLKPSELRLVNAQEAEVRRIADLLQPIRLRAQVRANRAAQRVRDSRPVES